MVSMPILYKYLAMNPNDTIGQGKFDIEAY